MNLYQHSLDALKHYLHTENVHQVMETYIQKKVHGIENRNDKTNWYAFSYPVILHRFEETRGIDIEKAWIERTSLVSSWISSIPTPKLDKQAMEDLSYLESKFYDLGLEEVGIESYLGAANTIHHGEIIFDTANNRPPVLIKSFLELADRIINWNGNWSSTFPTTTKLLHFMCPKLFPIYDRRVNELIYSGTLSYAKYHNYIFSLREFLQTSEVKSLLDQIANEEEVSLIRAVDIILFNTELPQKIYANLDSGEDVSGDTNYNSNKSY